MSEDRDILSLQMKYMALAHSSSENDRETAHVFAKKILKSPIRNARDLNTKIKIVETEIANDERIDTKTRYRLLELLALVAQADFHTDSASAKPSSQTRH